MSSKHPGASLCWGKDGSHCCREQLPPYHRERQDGTYFKRHIYTHSSGKQFTKAASIFRF